AALGCDHACRPRSADHVRLGHRQRPPGRAPLEGTAGADLPGPAGAAGRRRTGQLDQPGPADAGPDARRRACARLCRPDRPGRAAGHLPYQHHRRRQPARGPRGPALRLRARGGHAVIIRFLVVAAWLLLPSFAAAQGFSAHVLPPRFEDSAQPGTVYRNVIEIQNTSPEAVRFGVRTADWDLDENGGVNFDYALAADSCRPW